MSFTLQNVFAFKYSKAAGTRRHDVRLDHAERYTAQLQPYAHSGNTKSNFLIMHPASTKDPLESNIPD